jgi:copper chaperone
MYEFRVDGMTCSHCVSAVTRSVLHADGAAKVKVDLFANLVHVESTTDIDVIKDAIIDAGYAVTGSTTA